MATVISVLFFMALRYDALSFSINPNELVISPSQVSCSTGFSKPSTWPAVHNKGGNARKRFIQTLSPRLSTLPLYIHYNSLHLSLSLFVSSPLFFLSVHLLYTRHSLLLFLRFCQSVNVSMSFLQSQIYRSLMCISVWCTKGRGLDRCFHSSVLMRLTIWVMEQAVSRCIPSFHSWFFPPTPNSSSSSSSSSSLHYYHSSWEFLTPAFAYVLSLEADWQQVSLGPLDASRYSGRW